jgi:4-diphosphocytidyl-2-C-methyl-D-erythritol kinase
MVMQSIDLSDLIWIEEADGEHIEVESNVSHIPLDARNLVVVAAEQFRQHSKIRRGVKIRIEKNIPVAAGLAGGSSDAAAVLRGLNRLWNTKYSLDELASIGASIGSDVPFCVYGGCAVASGRGEKIERIPHSFRAWVVLMRPPVFVSTAEIYKALTPECYVSEIQSPKMVQALKSQDFDWVQAKVSNGLSETTMRLYPEVRDTQLKFENIAHVPVHMSGSGPTLFCLVKNQTSGTRIVNALRGFAKDVYLCRIT